MKPSQWTLRWVTLCGCGMLAASAAAVELPGTVQPSQLDERFKPRSEPQAKPEAPLVVPRQVAPQGSEQIRFELREIRIEGNTRYDKAVLESYYQHMLGKQVSLAELVDLANRLTAKYRQDGYLLTQVVVPEQSIEGGKVRLQVIEGYLEHVQIKGTVDGPRVRVEELLAPLSEKRPLDADTLERGLLLVGDLPGVNVQSVLSPGQALGSSNLDVALQQQRYEGFVSLDNRGSHYTDPTTLAFGATEFSRLGFYEQIDVLGAISPFSDATRYIQLRGTLPLGGMFAGDTLQIMGSYSKVNPDIPDSVFPFDSVSKSTEGSIAYNHPFIRSRSQNLSGGLALQWKDTDLGGPWSVYGELQWQYSFDPLLPSERFGVGGSGIGRGFAPGNITGDRGFALKIEPRYGQAVGYSWLRSYQAYAFYDWGKTYNLDVDDDEQQKLGSIGAGVRFNLTDQLSFNPEIARQVIGEPADQRDGKRDTRVLFNVVARF
ncbi:ShlB/FhaC/HecB family hemolysin secretion/activation protein [Pseudomonas paraeruginosa]|uniref:ShlB/FhaC/HecB family hemolysin secretion/activation protein n=1 Tax=Pseudomonas paraeruginosa TaxID=2994495 RepID=UPI0006B9C99A|nr:ShlB/FhaC/HecB family hemolysin secretion/activation protein [Pseudomonas paraeruginosa]KPD26725.1 hemolysin activation/secretion protein [Pseudomonas paraeruginosa]